MTTPAPQRLNRVGDLHTLESAAQELHVSYWTLDRLIRLHGIQVYVLGNARLVRPQDIAPHITR